MRSVYNKCKIFNDKSKNSFELIYNFNKFSFEYFWGGANPRHVEYLPYPDWNFVEESDQPCEGIISKFIDYLYIYLKKKQVINVHWNKFIQDVIKHLFVDYQLKLLKSKQKDDIILLQNFFIHICKYFISMTKKLYIVKLDIQ